jgi:hypothetical protein
MDLPGSSHPNRPVRHGKVSANSGLCRSLGAPPRQSLHCPAHDPYQSNLFALVLNEVSAARPELIYRVQSLRDFKITPQKLLSAATTIYAGGSFTTYAVSSLPSLPYRLPLFRNGETHVVLRRRIWHCTLVNAHLRVNTEPHPGRFRFTASANRNRPSASLVRPARALPQALMSIRSDQLHIELCSRIATQHARERGFIETRTD